jgi:hypothetical protein
MMSAQTGGSQLCSENCISRVRAFGVFQFHTHVEILKSPALNTAQRTYPITALQKNDAANTVTKNANRANNA